MPSSRPLKPSLALTFVSASLAACGLLPHGTTRISLPSGPLRIEASGQSSLAALSRFPPGIGLRFGGVSSLFPASADRREMIGVSDDHKGIRAYRFRLSASGDAFDVVPIDVISFDQSNPAAVLVDPEGLVVTPEGNLMLSCEGSGLTEPRVPPAIVEFGARGEFLRRLPVPDRFLPNVTGPQLKGMRPNFGFEPLAMTPDGSRLFTAAESALIQDGEVTTVDHGTMTRILEYRRHNGMYEPYREFMYPIEPVFKPQFKVGLAINGLVELIAIGDGRLLAMERSYVEEAGKTGQRLNRIRLFLVDLRGATDVSDVESLKGTTGLVPVTKTLVVDLSDLAGLTPDLGPSLDNFEGMAFGPALPDGRLSLLLVSDDNFNPKQRTWFLRLAIGR